MPIFRFPSRVPYLPRSNFSQPMPIRTLYWVGGTDLWDTTKGTKWSLTSGGAGGEQIPTSRDTTVFDANSGSGTVTLTASSYAAGVQCAGFAGKLYYAGGSLVTTAVDGTLNLSITGLHYLQVVSMEGGGPAGRFNVVGATQRRRR